MDVYSYLNSKDVAEYCRSINYEFNSLEKAFIINDCISIDIEEKHRLYREIMANDQDVAMDERFVRNGYNKSFFVVLDRFIEYENMLINELKQDNPNNVYTYKFKSEKQNDYYESRSIYSDYEKVMAAYLNDMKEELEFDPDIKYYGVIKMHELNDYRQLYANLDQKGNIIRVSGYIDSIFDEIFDMFWVYIPVPFKKGDILVSADKTVSRNNRMVLKSVCYWNRTDEYFEKRKHHGDRSDMVAFGYWVDETGHLYDECSHEYHNLTYYTGELKGNDRILKAVSSHMKGEIDEAMMLIAYEAVLNENAMKNTFPGWDYLEECYEKAGIGDIYKKRVLIKDFERGKKNDECT